MGVRLAGGERVMMMMMMMKDSVQCDRETVTKRGHKNDSKQYKGENDRTEATNNNTYSVPPTTPLHLAFSCHPHHNYLKKKIYTENQLEVNIWRQ